MSNGAWKMFECDVGKLFDAPTTRGLMQTSGLPQPDGDLALAGGPYQWLHVECKRHKRLTVPQWVADTEAAAPGPFLLVVKRWGVADPLDSYAITTLRHVKPWIDLAAERHTDGWQPRTSDG